MQAISEAIKATQAGNKRGDAENHGFNDNAFNRRNKFDGQTWHERSNERKLALKRTSVEAFLLLEKMEGQSGPVDLETGSSRRRPPQCGRPGVGEDIYESLSLLLEGDTFAVARGAPDMHGIELWRRVCQRCNPSTPASALNGLMRVMAPAHVQHRKDLLQNMDERHVLVETLRKDNGEEYSENTSIAAFVQMSPLEVRNFVGQSIDGGGGTTRCAIGSKPSRPTASRWRRRLWVRDMLLAYRPFEGDTLLV